MVKWFLKLVELFPKRYTWFPNTTQSISKIEFFDSQKLSKWFPKIGDLMFQYCPMISKNIQIVISPMFTVTNGLNSGVIQLYAILELHPIVTVKIGDAVWHWHCKVKYKKKKKKKQTVSNIYILWPSIKFQLSKL